MDPVLWCRESVTCVIFWFGLGCRLHDSVIVFANVRAVVCTDSPDLVCAPRRLRGGSKISCKSSKTTLRQVPSLQTADNHAAREATYTAAGAGRTHVRCV